MQCITRVATGQVDGHFVDNDTFSVINRSSSDGVENVKEMLRIVT